MATKKRSHPPDGKDHYRKKLALPSVDISSADKRPSLKNTEKAIAAKSIWELPGLQKHTFYAAAKFLQKCQPVQKKFERSNSRKDESNAENGLSPLGEKLLNQIALLFARTKDRKYTAKNVTATAMKKHKAEDVLNI
jgi:hypothetical protein